MIQKIRTSKTSKVIACYLAMMIVLQVAAPIQAYALTGGPAQPEFSSFTPIGTSDMVNLSSGDFNYNIPIMDVGGYPLNLAYGSGASMDQEASWVGLGWDLNVGQISRQVRGLPDDFDGDEMIYENNMKPNVTVGANFGAYATILAIKEEKGSATGETGGGEEGVSISTVSPKVNVNLGFGVTFNNYDGFGFTLTGGVGGSIGLGGDTANALNTGMNVGITSSASDGVSASPNVSFMSKSMVALNEQVNLQGSVGTTLNSRKGLESTTFSLARTKLFFKNGIVDDSRSFSSGGAISFADASFTPTKRVAMTSSNYNFNMNIGTEIWGFEGGVKFSGYRIAQGYSDSEKYKKEKAYGFENSYNASKSDVLDFNRENERTVSSSTTSLPVTNNTYDLYSIQGQGISGMFRPYKGQVGYVYDNQVTDGSGGGSLGVEFGIGGGSHWGINTNIITTDSHTKAWEEGNSTLARFDEKTTGNKPDYEKVYFKNIGGFHVDQEFDNLLMTKLGGYDPVRIGVAGKKFSRNTESQYVKKAGNSTVVPITSAIKRDGRVNRNQAIQKLTNEEAEKFGLATEFSKHVKYNQKYKHHTGEIQVTKEGGDRYVYGRAAYNVVKKEVTFDVSGNQGDCQTGLVPYTPGRHNTSDNKASGDQYFNRVTTPPFAHSYLLTAVLSSDYSDLTNDGPTDDDLGAYTKFIYDDSKTINTNYKWRMPYKKNHASYNEGLRSDGFDNKGSYLYGEKELLYIKKIETKTHVAIFNISLRKDGYGVDGENGGGSVSTSSRMYKLDKISLYSKPEYEALQENATPIKVAHFVYDYSLCPGIENNFGANPSGTNELDNQGGKLTLKKVYFTYRNSNMGMYTPYSFDYGYNPSYDIKAYDVWGNYKPNDENSGCGINDKLTNPEYPYVEQDKTSADLYTSAWNLKTITMPSGGKMNVEYESDEYKYVQDKEVMQMFKVLGAGTTSNPSLAQITNPVLYTSSSNSTNYLYVELNSDYGSDFNQKLIDKLKDTKIFFRFLLNMAKPGTGHDERYDYVEGYLDIDTSKSITQVPLSTPVLAIPIKLANKGDGFNPNEKINPISIAGINFGRKYLNKYVYRDITGQGTDDLEEVVMNIIGSVGEIANIAKSPNRQLIDRRIASKFVSGKSWIRLMQPDDRKYGGGCRVKDVTMHDQWDVMTNNTDNEYYKQHYGQEYTYNLEDGSSSGVATYEPLGNKENPFVQPFFDRERSELPLGPKESNYVEMPFGECFFPSPTITYSRVEVKNIQRSDVDDNNAEIQVKRHATGKVVTEFFTSKDYPTIVDYTDMLSHYDKSSNLSNILNLYVRNHMTLSQGFVVHTNDMNGKMKAQRVYAEGQTSAISGVDYIYEEDSNLGNTNYNNNQGRLNNVILTVDSKGIISQNLVGVDYDVINDFRENKSVTTNGGININTAFLPFTILTVVVPTPLPSLSVHENYLRTSVTTKVIHTSGILRKQVAYDAGSTVYTNNLAWDAETGAVLLTETINSFNDKYYSFNFPAYWAYDGMGQAAKNLGLIWNLKRVYGATGKYKLASSGTAYKASDYLASGDEIWVMPDDSDEFKAYIADIDEYNATLITEQGVLVNSDMLDTGSFKVIRSGFRNMQTASMASVTSMVNPLYNGTTLKGNIIFPAIYSSTTSSAYKIVSAAAIEYSDTWAAQCECMLPTMKFEGDKLVFDYTDSYENDPYNPYKYNVKGNWRPKVSYAYLTGRNSSTNSNDLRNTGYFNRFDPFYTYGYYAAANKRTWYINTANKSKWTYASEVSQYSPFGFEVENKDALNRYSSALYGYNFRFPTAVAANSRYNELGYDGFEDYDFQDESCTERSHFSFKNTIRPQKVTVSSGQAHSGRKSLKVSPNNSAVIEKRIVPCP
ncbi:hypothetical protein [Flavobacterium sp. C4GT6]|uniref:hypothetical protein n=1 Tax=Flavobacterium sp. C4GT6 TaxID=3103818 RepID=UPI002ED4C758